VKNEKILKAIQATRRERNKLLDRRERIGGGCEFNSSTTAMVERTVSLDSRRQRRSKLKVKNEREDMTGKCEKKRIHAFTMTQNRQLRRRTNPVIVGQERCGPPYPTQLLLQPAGQLRKPGRKRGEIGRK
jgi:hypothetical protein